MTIPVLRTDALVKDYGKVRALAGVSIAVEPGEIFGFLGPNGAGKSTLIRVLLNLLRPTSGRAEVFGLEPSNAPATLRARLGYLPGELAMAPRKTARELLQHFANLRDGAGRDRIAPLAERFGLELDRPFRGLSKGNKQKVGVVQAFMHAPELLILDEPTSGLDPLLQKEFLDLTVEAREAGATIFMSSHVLGEVEAVADRVAIIREGEIVDVSDVLTLRHNAGQRVQLEFAQPVPMNEFTAIEGVESVQVEGNRVTLLLRGEPDALLKAAAKHRVLHWSAKDRGLDDLFLDFYRVPSTTGADDDGDDRAE